MVETHHLDILNIHVKLFENLINDNKVMVQTRIFMPPCFPPVEIWTWELVATHCLDVLNIDLKLFEYLINSNKVMARTRIC